MTIIICAITAGIVLGWLDVFNYKTINQNTFDLERLYLNKINRISSTEYYKIKLKGIKIKYIKAYTNSSKIKKCNNYLEKVEPL